MPGITAAGHHEAEWLGDLISTGLQLAAALAATLLLVDWWRLRRQHAVQPCRLCAPGHSNHPTCAAPPQTPHAQHAQQRQQQAQPMPCGPAVQPAKQPAADAPALTRQPSVSLRAARSISPSPFAAAAAAASFAAATPPAQQPLSLLATGSSAGAISKRCSGASSGFSVESALERRPSPPHLSAMLGQIPFLQPRQPAELAGSTAAKADATTPPSIPALQRTLAAGPRDTPSPPRRATSPLSCRASLEDLRQLLRASEAGAVPQLERKLSEQLGRGAGADRQADAGAELESSGSGRELPVLSDWEVAPHELEIVRRPDGTLWQLGSGGFGRVYKAMRFGVQPVAVKVLAPASEAQYHLLDDFRREVLLLKALKDPHIVSFLGASLSPDFTMLVTEYCEGGSLAVNLAAGRISWYRRGRQVALDTARGLTFLHARGVVHFDLKSPNILLDRHGKALIADLGPAKILHHERSTVTGNLGTLNWAAPEILLGQRSSAAADIYSLGVVLWEICSGGEVPVRGRMRDLRVPDDCPAQVAALVAQCMSPDPALRPTAAQVAERLLDAPGAPPAGPPTQLARRSAQPAHSSRDAEPEGSMAATQVLAPASPAAAEGATVAALLSAAAGRPPRPRGESVLPAQPQQPAHSQRQQQQSWPPSPLLPAASVSSEPGALAAPSPAAQVAAAVVAKQQMDRGASMPLHMDSYGLGIF